uniref:Uncharacterized protein n=1 Tax=Nelumbo nucifera TaxID=4432 RepID=A0A822Y2A4_NELNU|nr:TPA_asm: hypothetical protein HUJ06_027849 [Nelumbo nucifera]
MPLCFTDQYSLRGCASAHPWSRVSSAGGKIKLFIYILILTFFFFFFLFFFFLYVSVCVSS